MEGMPPDEIVFTNNISVDDYNALRKAVSWIK